MEFKDLEYISLEGGGGKGAVYLGAIKALEKKFYVDWMYNNLLKNEKGSLINPSNIQKEIFISNYVTLKGNERDEFEKSIDFIPYSILDYYDVDLNVPKIKGIAGSSAGAITAFPLALGLNSSDIKLILDGYEFEKEFMSSNIHAGKYRMVGMDSNGKAKILVAEDKMKKLGENKIEPFDFDFVQAELNGTIKKDFGSNSIKSIIRNQIVSFGVKILVTGILNIYEPIDTFFKKLKKQGKISSIMSDGEIEKIEDAIELGPLSIKFFKIWEMIFGFILSKFPSPVKLSNSSVNIVLNLFKLLLFPKKLGGFIPRDNITGAISNLVWDRGIYAGFEVREFFFRILMLAISKDTHFRRKLLDKNDMLKKLEVSKEEILNIEGCIKDDFKFDPKHQYKEIVIELSKSLAENLTFETFFEISGINLSCCVSNATSGQPMYFSAYFTPNYPVIEAMGASMSFPLAFKPLYNESNVLINNKSNFRTDLDIQKKPFVSSAETKFKNIIYKESFSQSDFIKYQNIVLAYIKKTFELKFSLNSNLSFRSYLPYLRAIIFKSNFNNFKYENSIKYVKNEIEEEENGIDYVKDDIEKLCYFFYNSVFKGLHVDGGATNNLPIAVHTYVTPSEVTPSEVTPSEVTPSEKEKHSNIQVLDIKKNVFSLKLDNSFPPDIKEVVLRELTLDKNKKTLERLSNWQDKFATYTLIKQIKKGLKLKNALKRIKNDAVALDEILNMSDEVWVKICEEIIEEKKLTKNGFTPWNKQIFFLNSAMTPLQFGMDQGQIESIEDNENIVPLYCFGLSVFDFDLASKKLKPLVEIANKNSEKAVLEYFQ